MQWYDLVEVRFRRGENRRFPVARLAAARAGYPDVPTYLWATGQVTEWCEEIPQAEFEMIRRAEQVRHELLSKAAGVPVYD